MVTFGGQDASPEGIIDQGGPRSPVRRTDYRRPDAFLPEDWAPIAPALKEQLYQERKEKDPDAAQRAYDAVQAYNKALAERKEAAKTKTKRRGKGATAVSAYDRTIIEYCCSADSRIGRLADASCRTRRLTMSEDLRTRKGGNIAKQMAGEANAQTLLWASIPCTGGSARVDMNLSMAAKAGRQATIDKIEAHIDDFEKIWVNFKAVARMVRSAGGKIAIEWPRRCKYWKFPDVKAFILEMGLVKATFHGCCLGLRTDDGTPMQKGWTVATDDQEIFLAFDDPALKCKHSPEEHYVINGSVTKSTELYTDQMVNLIHAAWKTSCALPDGMGSKSSKMTKGSTGLHDGAPAARKAKAFSAVPAAIRHKMDEYDCPYMPRRRDPYPHRSKMRGPVFGCGTRPVRKDEIRRQTDAQLAMDAEFGRLSDKGTFGWDTVQPWAKIAAKARRTSKKIHVSSVFGICVEKGYDLPDRPDGTRDPDRKYKGRYVLGGHDVRDEQGEAALFQDLSSNPATMESSKAVDAYACFPGNKGEQADAEQAYVQRDTASAELVGDFTETWVRLPKEYWPQSWIDQGIIDPVVRLLRPLYGHPDAGGLWEKFCDGHLVTQGFVPVDNWLSTYWHPRLKLYLMVYVDDFKMAGPAGNLAEGWALVRSVIKTEDPKPIDRCLGCKHVRTDGKLPNGHKVTFCTWDMQSSLRAALDRYVELAQDYGFDPKLKQVPTPFLEESVLDEDAGTETGILGPIAASILMQVLYTARLARFDLLKAVASLASKVSKWTRKCDRQLNRLMSYIFCSLEDRMVGYIGDAAEDLHLELYSDADFASDLETRKSTTGVFLVLSGPNTFFPLSGVSKKQSAVSHSTPEAEIVAAAQALRTVGLPGLDLWDTIFMGTVGRKVQMYFMEDNTATIAILKTGKNPNLRHLGRTHDVSVKWLKSVLDKMAEQIAMGYIETKWQCADIFTKAFDNHEKWAHARFLIGFGAPWNRTVHMKPIEEALLAEAARPLGACTRASKRWQGYVRKLGFAARAAARPQTK